MKPTPLENLLAEKEQIRQQCRQQELKLNETFAYFSENAGSLLISGLSSLLFPGPATSKKNKALPSSSAYIPVDNAQSASFSLSDYLSIGKMMVPAIWEITKPMLITWGIKKVKKIIAQSFKSSKAKSQ